MGLIESPAEVRSSLANYGTLLKEEASHALAEKQLLKQHHRRQRSRKSHQVNAQDLGSWMKAIPDDTYLSAITIPGSHDSAAYHSLWPFVATQTATITEQLDSGVRYLDFRCGLRDNVIEMVHGVTLLNRTLASLLGEVYAWLDAHPSEAVAVQIKEDRAPEKSPYTYFSAAVFALIDPVADDWWTLDCVTPRLGPSRRRIQLVRRFHRDGRSPVRAGIDVVRWPDNPSTPQRLNRSYRHAAPVVIQDHYNPEVPVPLATLVEDKFALVDDMMDRAAKAEARDTWFLNFASAYQLSVAYQSSPHDVAVGAWGGLSSWVDGVNRLLRDRLLELAPLKRPGGVVLLDFVGQPDAELVGLLVATNFEPAAGAGWRIGGRRWRAAVTVLFRLLVLVFIAGSIALLLGRRSQFGKGQLGSPEWKQSIQ